MRNYLEEYKGNNGWGNNSSNSPGHISDNMKITEESEQSDSGSAKSGKVGGTDRKHRRHGENFTKMAEVTLESSNKEPSHKSHRLSK